MLFGDAIPESSAGDPYATLLLGDVHTGDDLGGVYFLATGEAGVNANYAAPRAYGGVGASVRGLVVATSSFYSYPAFPNPITGGFNLASLEYRDTAMDAFPRARLPGLRLGLVRGVESVLPPRSIFAVGARAYAVALSANLMYSLTDMTPVALDITGPWR
jgi:hypothetical protein